MRKILSIFSICLLLVSCATPQQGSGIRGNINITQPDFNKASLYIKYSSGRFFNVAPTVEVNTKNSNEKFLLGDDEYIVIKVDNGPVKITVFPPLDKIKYLSGNPYIKASDPFGAKQEKQKILTKENIIKNNNYYFVIRPERGSGSFLEDFLDHTAGKAVTINYGIYETNQSNFGDFQSSQPLGVFGSINKVPNIHGFTEDMFDREKLLEISQAEEKFKTIETEKIKETIYQSEIECLKQGLNKESIQFKDCTFENWKNNYGKKYFDYKKDISIEISLIQRAVRDNLVDDTFVKMGNSLQNSFELSETTKDIVTLAITLVASYYLGKALGETLSNSRSVSNVKASGSSARSVYVCRVNYGGGGCLSGSSFGVRTGSGAIILPR